MRQNAAAAKVNASSTASLLLLLQLGSRIVTFSLNQALLAYTTPAAFGTATIQLEPLLNTVLFLCREGIRAALARSSPSSRSAIYKTSLIPLVLGFPLAIAAFSLYGNSVSDEVLLQPYFKSAASLYGLATVLELCSEPYFNRAQAKLNVKLRVSIEGSAVIARAVITLLVVLYGRERTALLAFGLGQLAYSMTLLARYAWHFRGREATLSDPKASGLDSSILKLAYALTKQSFFKQILTEGDKVIVSRISPIQDQGGYALALNYGSLVARILFQPLEESSRLQYSRSIGNSDPTDKKDPAKADSQAGLASSLSLLRQLIKLQVYLALIFTCFCPFYTTPLLYHVLRRSQWLQTSAPSLLRHYLFLLPLLGLNGILEAFVQAVASEKELGQMSWALVGWSAIFLTSCWIGVSKLGMQEEVLIWANGISMACRIAYSANFVRRFCRERGVDSGLLEPVKKAKYAIIASLAMAFVMRWSEGYMPWATLAGFAKHIAVGIACFAPCFAIAIYADRATLQRFLPTAAKAKTT